MLHEELTTLIGFFAELMVDLHEAILQIGRHFISHDPKYAKLNMEPDFSLESHTKDHERFTQGFSSGLKRAKALVGTI